MHALVMLLALVQADDLPPAEEIIESVVHRTRQDRARFEELGLSYYKELTVYDTKHGKVPEIIERKTWLMWYENGESRQKLIEVDGKPVTDAKPESPGPDAIVRLPDLYEFFWDDPPITNELHERISHYKIRFEPKEKIPKTHTRQEAGLVRMSGVMYIDAQYRFVAHLRADLPEPFRKALVFKANEAHAEFSERNFAGMWVFDRVFVKVNYAVFGVETHNTYVYEYDYGFGYPLNEEPPAQ